MEEFYKGNLKKDREKSLGQEGEGWLIGDFPKFSDDDLKKTNLLELEYWKIEKGKEEEHRAKVQKSVGEITILLKGEVRGFIGEQDITLAEKDYVYKWCQAPINSTKNVCQLIKLGTRTVLLSSGESPISPEKFRGNKLLIWGNSILKTKKIF